MSETPFITGLGRGRARGRRDIAESEQLADRRPGRPRFQVDDWEGELAETQSDVESKWKSMEDSAPGPSLCYSSSILPLNVILFVLRTKTTAKCRCAVNA